MALSEQKKKFYAAVLPSRPNSWEVDDIFDRLAEVDETAREALLSHVGAIWPVSHSLCFAYLSNGVKALDHFSIELLDEWVRQILDLYEIKGLRGARQFMADVDRFFLGPMRGEAGVSFEEISARMVHYLRGISGRSLALNSAPLPSTDTTTIFLPAVLDTFQSKQKNILFYKLLVSLQWAHIESRIFSEVLESHGEAQDIFTRYPDRHLAIDLFSVLQFLKAFGYLQLELPGLVRQARNLCLKLIQEIAPAGMGQQKCATLQNLFIQGVGIEQPGDVAPMWTGNSSLEKVDELGTAAIFEVLPELYAEFTRLSGSYTLGAAALLLGEFDFAGAGETIRLRRAEDKEKFVAMLAGFLEQQGARQNEEREGGNVPSRLAENFLLLVQGRHGQKSPEKRTAMLVDNEGLEIPEELAALIREIEDDLGTLPAAYVQAAAGQAGRGFNRTESAGGEEVAGAAARDVQADVQLYNEWDYRRAGYRKDWCSLTEKTLQSVQSGFVARTLEKYQPQLNKLRRQFEMLRTRDRFIRRRRHGDDIDLDALIEALGDTRAGLNPSDRLFVRLLRDERDIATMFLVDMSNSTEGWVGVAVKEALVLLAEALEVVGDRYGIYGFSGMRRSRSELFHIKHLHESYGAAVQGRIAAIGPKEYTRMGPPIRHLTKKLLEIQSNVRLLVVISDGKPEDYDDYKGQYAIEDTRRALLEARGCGVHSFCITIDKSAHDYLAHMFGRGNFIFVDEVFSLPAKMAEMYRVLTS